MRRLVDKGHIIFFEFDLGIIIWNQLYYFLVERVKGRRPYLHFKLSCYHRSGEKILYYPINASFYAFNNDFVPIITLIPDRGISNSFHSF